jgi:hypothetical protein
MQSVMRLPERRDGEENTLLQPVAQRYDRCHPADSFTDLVKRASFSKEDRRLMEDWLDASRRWRRP